MLTGIDHPDDIELNTDVLYETTFALTEVKQNPIAYEMMGEPMPLTLRRLAKTGRKSPVTGNTVRLEVALGASGKLCTSLQACRRFLERLNGMLE